jgi:hypothetical protein
MPIVPNGSVRAVSVGGSPRGWTFISNAKCWRRWAWRYLIGFLPANVKVYFDLGSAYHALMEGQSQGTVQAAYGHVFEEAQELAYTRQDGPPLGHATAVEQEYAIFGGKMTSKPDREETESKDGKGPATRMRDFKSAMRFSDYDEEAWNVDGGIVGELIAAGVEKGIVDIVLKYVAAKRVKLVPVTLTKAKADALEALVDDFWETLERRVRKAAGGSAKDAPRAFPPNLSECVGKYGPCDYYARCWGKPPESNLYSLSPAPPRRWVTGRNGELKLPGKLTPDLIEKAAKKVRAGWNLGAK